MDFFQLKSNQHKLYFPLSNTFIINVATTSFFCHLIQYWTNILVIQYKHERIAIKIPGELRFKNQIDNIIVCNNASIWESDLVNINIREKIPLKKDTETFQDYVNRIQYQKIPLQLVEQINKIKFNQYNAFVIQDTSTYISMKNIEKYEILERL